MKKIIIVIIPCVILMAIIGIYVFVPSILPVWFVVRHTGIYLLFTYLTILGIILMYRFFLTKIHTSFRLWLVRGLVAISGGIILLGGGELQLYLVNAYEIPPVMGCVYYDKYDNLIYNSQYRGTCPELKNLTYTIINPEETIEPVRETLSFDVQEETIVVINNSEYKNNLNSRIEIEYKGVDSSEASSTHEKLIQMIRIDSEEFVDIKNLETSITSHIRNRYLKMVVNEFGEMLIDFEITESMARSTITEYSDSQEYIIENGQIMGLDLSEITTLEPVITVQEATYTEIPDEGYGYVWDNTENVIVSHYYDIEMTEKTIESGIESDLFTFAQGKRMNDLNNVNLFFEEPYRQPIGYRATYGESQWRSFSERYDISNVAVYPSRDVEFGYHYYDNVFRTNELRYLDYYTKTDGEYETTEEVSILKFERDESNYLIDEGRSIEVTLTDYGRKLTYFSTSRAGDGKYTILPNNVSELLTDDVIYSDFMPLKMFYNSKIILFDISTYKPLYMIPQKNLLFYGVPSGVLVYL